MNRNLILKQLVDLVKTLSQATIYEVGKKLDDMDEKSLTKLEMAVNTIDNFCAED